MGVATRAHLRNPRHYQSTSSRNYLKMAPETPKGASSRLLSMKFMQRAAASAGSTPDSDAPSSKKRRLDRGDNDYDLNITSESIQAAIDERDAKRQAAIQQHASNDTHWVLNTNVGNMAGKSEKKPMRVQYVGYDDFESDEDVDKTQLGRTSTKKNKKLEEVKPQDSNSEESEEDGESEGEDEDDDSGRRKRKRDSNASGSRSRSMSRSNSKQSAEAEKAKHFRDKRKKKDVNINKPITSISNAGAGAPSNSQSMTCYLCQGKGHKAADCPQKGKKSKGKR